jgi:HK97 family phage portal protein
MFKKNLGLARRKSATCQTIAEFSLLPGASTTESSFLKDYVLSSPVFIATKLIANAIAGIPIILKDINKNELIYQHKALEILRDPSPFTTSSLLMKELASYYILTGNSYLKVSGNNEPVELMALNPRGISIKPGRDGFPGDYDYQFNNMTDTFRRDGRIFVDPQNNHLGHLRDFNPDYSAENLVGYSTFTGCVLEIIQGICANVHNNALLKNQARPSGLMTYSGKDVLDDEQVQEIQSILKEKLSGAANTGKTTFLNGEFKWQQLSESMKDMDFPTLKRTSAQTIFLAADIPLAMVSPDNMTFSNMAASKYAFYDNAVIPRLKEIIGLLNRNVLSRYKNTENLTYWFDESAIESLQLRKLEYATQLFQSGIGTRDEARLEIGQEPADNPEDGDAFFSSTAQAAAPNDPGAKSVGKAEYVSLMKRLKGIDGNRLYDDDLIDSNVKLFFNGN